MFASVVNIKCFWFKNKTQKVLLVLQNDYQNLNRQNWSNIMEVKEGISQSVISHLGTEAITLDAEVSVIFWCNVYVISETLIQIPRPPNVFITGDSLQDAPSHLPWCFFFLLKQCYLRKISTPLIFLLLVRHAKICPSKYFLSYFHGVSP